MINFNKDNIADEVLKQLSAPEFLGHPEFTVESIMKTNAACAAIADWVIAVVQYNFQSKLAEPLRLQLILANEKLEVVEKAIETTRAKAAQFQSEVDELKIRVTALNVERSECVELAQKTLLRTDRITNLIKALSNEEKSWKEVSVPYHHEKVYTCCNV